MRQPLTPIPGGARLQVHIYANHEKTDSSCRNFFPLNSAFLFCPNIQVPAGGVHAAGKTAVDSRRNTRRQENYISFSSTSRTNNAARRSRDSHRKWSGSHAFGSQSKNDARDRKSVV